VKKYVVVLTIDRHPPGTDATDLYPDDVRDELVRFGYLDEVETVDLEVTTMSDAEPVYSTAQARKPKDGG
jgi:hypothetical protein